MYTLKWRLIKFNLVTVQSMKGLTGTCLLCLGYRQIKICMLKMRRKCAQNTFLSSVIVENINIYINQWPHKCLYLHLCEGSQRETGEFPEPLTTYPHISDFVRTLTLIIPISPLTLTPIQVVSRIQPKCPHFAINMREELRKSYL